MPLFDWLGSLFSASPAATGVTPPPNAYGGGGLLDPQAIRQQALWSGLGALSSGLIAAGQRRPAMQPSLLPQALGAFQPAYAGALQSGYQQAALQQQFADREARERQIAALPAAEQQLYRTLGPEGYARYVTQRDAPYSQRPGERRMAGTTVISQAPEAPVTMSPGQQRIDPATGRVIAALPPSPHYAGTPQTGVWEFQPPGAVPGGQPQAAPDTAPPPAAAPPGGTQGPIGVRNNNWLSWGITGGRAPAFATPEEGVARASQQIDQLFPIGTVTPTQLATTWAQGPGYDPARASPQVQASLTNYTETIRRAAGARDANTPIDMRDPATRLRVLTAMGQFETGGLPQGADQVIQRGLALASQPNARFVPIAPGQGPGQRAAPAPQAAPGTPGVRQVLPPQQAGGTFPGNSLEATAWNIVNDPNRNTSSRDYAAAYSILSQPHAQQVQDPNNPAALVTVLVPRELPAHVVPPGTPPSAATAPPAAAAPAPGAAPGAAAAPPAAPAPRPAPTPLPGTSVVSPQAREAVRRVEQDGTRLLDAANNFERVSSGADGVTRLYAWLRNPLSPAAAELQQAYENMIMAARGESFANTGVLQPNEMAMLANQFRDPTTLRGALASPDTRRAQLGQLRGMVQSVINRQRQSIGQPPIEFPDTPSAAAPRVVDYDSQGRPVARPQ